MRPLVLLAACSLLGPPTLVAASGYPPPTGPYRAPEISETLAEQARATLNARYTSPTELPPERHYREPLIPRPTAADHDPPIGGAESGSGLAYPGIRGTAPSRPPGGGSNLGFPPLALEGPALVQHDSTPESTDLRISPRIAPDSGPHYAQVPFPGARWDDAQPYSPADRYPGPSFDTGYYHADRVPQEHRMTAPSAGSYYPHEVYRGGSPVPDPAFQETTPDNRSYYARDAYPAAPADLGEYPAVPTAQPYDALAREAGLRALPPGYADSFPDAGAYGQGPIPLTEPGAIGEASSPYASDPYRGFYRDSAPSRRPGSGSAAAYAGAASLPDVTAVPVQQASYAEEGWLYDPASALEPPPSHGWAARFRPSPEASGSGHGAGVYPGDHSPRPHTEQPDRPTSFSPADALLGGSRTDPVGTGTYYGDYVFAPLPAASSWDSHRQRRAAQPLNPYRYPGNEPRRSSHQFRDAGQLQDSVTGMQGKVYRFRPLHDQHSAAPHAQTWEPRSDPRAYPDRQPGYPADRSPSYPARW